MPLPAAANIFPPHQVGPTHVVSAAWSRHYVNSKIELSLSHCGCTNEEQEQVVWHARETLLPKTYRMMEDEEVMMSKITATKLWHKDAVQIGRVWTSW